VLVVEHIDGLNLIAQQLEGTTVKLWVVQAEDLNSVLLAIGGSRNFNFGAEAGAEGPAERVLSNCGSHFGWIVSNFEF